MAEPGTLRVHIPLALRNRGGRPRILPPKDIERAYGTVVPTIASCPYTWDSSRSPRRDRSG